MMISGRTLIFGITVLLLVPLMFVEIAQAAETKGEKTASAREVTWDDLMPPVDQEIVRKYEAEEISYEEALEYMVKLGEIPVESLNQSRVRIPGYLVPLNIDKNQMATELLLVPGLGACIHVPPPPPNQTIYIRYDKGIKVTEAGYTPYWLEGVIKVERHKSEYTEVVYAMVVDSIREFE